MLRLVLMGTSDFAVPVFQAIFDRGLDVVAVYTAPPRPAGRGMKVRISAVHSFALSLGLPVFTPFSLKDSKTQSIFKAHCADAVVVVAYGLILPKAVLDFPRFGCLNLHGSLLPRWRGAAPVQRSIMAGDAETGVTVMRMDAGLDTGPVCMSEVVTISQDMTGKELHALLAQRGTGLMIRALDSLSCGELKYTQQAEDAVTYADKICKNELRIDWSGSALKIHDHVRALSPSPGAWCEMILNRKTERVKLLCTSVEDDVGPSGMILNDQLTIACGGGGGLRVHMLQRAGRNPIHAADFLRGASLLSTQLVM